MKIALLSPAYFSDESLIGGGERYPTELGRALAETAEVTLVSFGPRRRSAILGKLRVELFPVRRWLRGNRGNPWSWEFLPTMLQADVIHLHQAFTLTGDMACLLGALLGRRVFVTHHGGGGEVAFSHRLPIHRLCHGVFGYSDFMARALPARLRARGVRVIKGGIDLAQFSPDGTVERRPAVLFVGRLLPHKGVDCLVRAFRAWGRAGWRLRLLGRPYDGDYLRYLQELAEGLPVDFVHDADDAALLREYRSARVTVLPSTHRDYQGRHHALPELMGFTLLESQACGTPAICTDAGAMGEFVDDGRTGRVVPQNAPAALAAALEWVCAEERWPGLAEASRRHMERFSWQRVAAAHLEAYGTEGRREKLKAET